MSGFHAKKRTAAGFTLIELLVVIAILALIAAILFPVLAKSRDKARQTVCMSHLSQLSRAILMYKQDYDSVYPYWNWSESSRKGSLSPNHLETLWFAAIFPYVKSADVYQCPNANETPSLRESMAWHWTTEEAFDTAGIPEPLRDRPVHYGFSESLSSGRACREEGSACSEGGLDRPADSLLVADCLQGLTNDFEGRPDRTDPADPRHRYLITRVAYANGPANCYEDESVCGGAQIGTADSFGTKMRLFEKQTRHNNGSNLCFADGHAKWYPHRGIVYDLFAGDNAP